MYVIHDRAFWHPGASASVGDGGSFVRESDAKGKW